MGWSWRDVGLVRTDLIGTVFPGTTLFGDVDRLIENVDPQLLPLEGTVPYHPLAYTSRALDTWGVDDTSQGGTPPPSCPPNDQRGFERSAPCDLGAYELPPVVFVDGFESADTAAWSSTVP